MLFVLVWGSTIICGRADCFSPTQTTVSMHACECLVLLRRVVKGYGISSAVMRPHDSWMCVGWIAASVGGQRKSDRRRQTLCSYTYFICRHNAFQVVCDVKTKCLREHIMSVEDFSCIIDSVLVSVCFMPTWNMLRISTFGWWRLRTVFVPFFSTVWDLNAKAFWMLRRPFFNCFILSFHRRGQSTILSSSIQRRLRRIWIFDDILMSICRQSKA